MKYIISLMISLVAMSCSTGLYKKRVFEDHEPRTPHQKCIAEISKKLQQCHYDGVADCFPGEKGYNGPYDVCYKGE